MKLTDQHIKLDVPQQIQREFPKQNACIGTMKLRKGQKFYELDINTGLIKEADVVTFATLSGIYRKCVIKDGAYLYESAINLSNAARKFKNKLNQYLCLK